MAGVTAAASAFVVASMSSFPPFGTCVLVIAGCKEGGFHQHISSLAKQLQRCLGGFLLLALDSMGLSLCLLLELPLGIKVCS